MEVGFGNLEHVTIQELNEHAQIALYPLRQVVASSRRELHYERVGSTPRRTASAAIYKVASKVIALRKGPDPVLRPSVPRDYFTSTDGMYYATEILYCSIPSWKTGGLVITDNADEKVVRLLLAVTLQGIFAGPDFIHLNDDELPQLARMTDETRTVVSNSTLTMYRFVAWLLARQSTDISDLAWANCERILSNTGYTSGVDIRTLTPVAPTKGWVIAAINCLSSMDFTIEAGLLVAALSNLNDQASRNDVIDPFTPSSVSFNINSIRYLLGVNFVLPYDLR